MTKVWPGLVVEENNIQVHVSALRKALDEEKSGQTYLVTVPGRGYRLIDLKSLHSASDDGPVNSLSPTLSDKSSIAVLPFQNMSVDSEQEYFADGMVDEIITGLSRIKWLSVISRNSTFTYKNKPVAIKEVADKFGVRYVLEGSVRKSGNRVRISAQLIDAKTDAHLWAEQYDRVLENVFALQDEITMCVVGAIEPSSRKAETDRIKRQRPTNLNAYDLVLRSLPFVLGHIPKDFEVGDPAASGRLEAAAQLRHCSCVSRQVLPSSLRSGRDYMRKIASQQFNMRARRSPTVATMQRRSQPRLYVIALIEHDADTALRLFDRALELSQIQCLCT